MEGQVLGRVLGSLRVISKQLPASRIRASEFRPFSRSLQVFACSARYETRLCNPTRSHIRTFGGICGRQRASTGQPEQEPTNSGSREQFHEKPADLAFQEEKSKQARTPWQREGTDAPPAQKKDSQAEMNKG